MRLFVSLSACLLVGCPQPSGLCNFKVPFSVDTNVSEQEANRLAMELNVSSIANECERACQFLSEEKQAPAATWTAEVVATCTLRMPSTDAMGLPVVGSLRCSGTGTRCEIP